MTDIEILKPDTPDHLQQAVAWLVSEERAAYATGRDSKAMLGRPQRPDCNLDLSALTGILLYEPEELVLSAKAATPMRDIQAVLDENQQMLAFEPPNLSPLLGLDADQTGTIGGLIASNLAGPRRLKAGAARDHFLGFKAVSGRGEAFKSGGRVVKNVTGYDLPKLLCGSWGTLGIMHEVTVKVLPRPQKSRTVLIRNISARAAGPIMRDALNSTYEVSGACWIPGSAALASSVSYLAESGENCVALRLEGPGPSVDYRCKALRDLFADHGGLEELHSSNSTRFWQEIRDAMPFAQPSDQRMVWKISVPPADGPAILDGLLELEGADGFMDWGGGLIWLAHDPAALAAGDLVRDAVSNVDGHATLIRASEEARSALPVFHPEEPALAMLTKRLKNSFDPHGLLNPGRMYEGV